MVVVGGGHNGLVAAAYLAKAGLDVLVLERRDVLGGAAVTEELWPGYRVSTAAYLISLLQPQIVRDLEVGVGETGAFVPGTALAETASGTPNAVAGTAPVGPPG